MTAAARLAALLGLLALSGGPVLAETPDGGALRDRDFGVTAQGAIGLERRVEMFQWQRAGNGYRTGWSTTAIDSTDFAAGHENPPEVPMDNRRWAPTRLLLDGRPVAPEAIEALARWRVMRPDFSALPGNMSATFQPEGDGLGSAANPVRPEVGDLRITWRELRMPPAPAGLALRDGRWELDPRTAEPTAARGGVAERASFGWMLLGAAIAALAAAVVMRRRRRHSQVR